MSRILASRQSAIYAAIEVAAVAMILLSFLPWIRLTLDTDYYTSQGLALSDVLRGLPAPGPSYIDGTDVDVLANAGTTTIVMAIVVFLAAVVNRSARVYSLDCVISVGGALIVAALIYTVADGWPNNFTATGLRFSQTYTWEFWTVFALAAFCSLTGFALLFTHKPEVEDAKPDDLAWA